MDVLLRNALVSVRKSINQLQDAAADDSAPISRQEAQDALTAIYNVLAKIVDRIDPRTVPN